MAAIAYALIMASDPTLAPLIDQTLAADAHCSEFPCMLSLLAG